jgi:hypothetical protein
MDSVLSTPVLLRRIAQLEATVGRLSQDLGSLSRHPATEPYWSAGVDRFDDPSADGADGADVFGTCYAASAIEVAFAESVIHECGRFVHGSFGRSGLRKLRVEKLKPSQVDDLCDRFNVTAV